MSSRAGGATLLVILLSAGPASAQQEERPPRIFGAGTALGGGFGAFSVTSTTGSTSTGVLPAIMLPTLELQGFITEDEYSIDVTVPLTNLIISSVAVEGFIWQTDAFFNFNLGSGTARFIIGPGLGFTAGTVNGVAAASIRFPAELGLELLTSGNGFGFKILARPWFEVAPTSSADAIGGGLIGLLGFSGYVTE